MHVYFLFSNSNRSLHNYCKYGILYSLVTHVHILKRIIHKTLFYVLRQNLKRNFAKKKSYRAGVLSSNYTPLSLFIHPMTLEWPAARGIQLTSTLNNQISGKNIDAIRCVKKYSSNFTWRVLEHILSRIFASLCEAWIMLT